MPEWLIWLSGVLLFVVILSVTVAVHEAGHMIAAKRLGLEVPEFSIGFGKKIYSRTGKKTTYNVRSLPFGGFVIIEDKTQPEGSFERSSLGHVAPWRRQIIFAAGATTNIVIGSILLVVALMSFPYNVGSTVVSSVQSCADGPCGSLEAGLLAGDKIVSINGTDVSNLSEINAAKKGQNEINLVVERNGEQISLPNVQLTKDTYLMGITVGTKEVWRTFPDAVSLIGATISQNVQSIINLPSKVVPVAESIFTGHRPADSPGSVVSMGKKYGDIAVAPEGQTGNKLYVYLMYTALLNLGIGLLNLIPIGVLDGGKMLVAFMDSCKKLFSKISNRVYRPTGKKFYLALTAVSAVAIFGFMGLLILSDFSLIFRGNL